MAVPPAVVAAAPATAGSSAAPATSAGTPASQVHEPTAEDALNAGLAMIAARDVCKLPAADLARFRTYGEWAVQGDAQRKAIYVMAAKEAAKAHQAVIEQGRQESYKASTCPRVMRILALMEHAARADPTLGQGAAR